jgi:hypothetical protein
MWALTNRARLNPTGEGIDVNEGLAPGTLSATSRQPLAFNTLLEDAANLHSTNMINRDFFSHVDPLTGKNWQSRTNDAGYAGSTLENISWQGTSATMTDALATQFIYQQHQALFWDTEVNGRGHRVTMLDDRFQEIGIGETRGSFTFTDKNTGQLKTLNASMITQNFGDPSAGGQFLTGITFNDTDGDKFYSVGEARGGVTVTTTAGAVVSGTAGAFSKAISAGVQTITFSGGGLPAAVSASINVTAGRNALVDLVGTNALETSVSLTALSGVVKIIGLGNIGLTLTGNTLDNTIVSALGNDQINGGAGTDTAVYSGLRASYTVTNNNNGTWTVIGREGTDTLTAMEKIQFNDQILTIGTVTPVNRAPTVAVADKTLKAGEVVKIASWVTYSDADGNAPVQYQIVDKGTAATSGALLAPNGTVVAAGTILTVSAADLAKVSIRGGSGAGTETMEIRAFDGTAWSTWDPFKITTTLPNRAPVATIDDKTVRANEWVKITDMLKYSDADGNAAVQYQFIDLFNGAGSAYLWNNEAKPANTAFTVNAADLGNVWARGGQGGGWDNMQVRAFDGKDWGAWDTFKFTTVPNAAPVAVIDDKAVSKNEWVKASTLLKATDADGNAITEYQFVDKFAAKGSAYFYTPDKPEHAGNEVFTVKAADLGNVWIRGAQTAGWDTMQVRASDGVAWGAWDSFKFTTLNNSAPVVSGGEIDLKIGKTVTAKSLFSVNDPDAGDAITQYQFFDDNALANSGRFSLNSKVLAADTIHTVLASEMAKLNFTAGSAAGTDLLWARAFDGDIWSAWHKFDANSIV